MKYLLTAAQARRIDEHTIQEIGVPSLVLMERAALAVCDTIEKESGGDRSKKILLFSGSGNNGADACAVARLLHLKGYGVSTIVLGDPERYTEELKIQIGILEKLNLPVTSLGDLISSSEEPGADSIGIRTVKKIMEGYDVIVDGIFGIGLSRYVEGYAKYVIEAMNEAKKPIIAIDVPSGISATTGAILGTAVNARVTVTFGKKKVGLTLFPGADYAGAVVEADCGFVEEGIEDLGSCSYTYELSDLSRIPLRSQSSNKGTYGRVLVIAGSDTMSGAAFLAAKAALRCGVGLVRLLTTRSNREAIQKLLPEAVLGFYDEMTNFELEKAMDEATAVVIGPGLGKAPRAKEVVELVLSHDIKRLLLDADALNLVAELHWQEKLAGHTITPHMGEMARLNAMEIGDIKMNVVDVAKAFAQKYQCNVVLKDARTVVAVPEEEAVFINTSGNSGMSTAGAGDVLTGVIAGMWAAGLNNAEGARMGVYLHGLAGDEAAATLGERFMTASDIIEHWKDTLKSIE
ncbi:MAG: NAD(P)H-hydrate dehydratase [Lachnospiraceae bacterium]|nr:NAD(P)H-hydrate dehydratase [Lachnospiraceae bacterium]